MNEQIQLANQGLLIALCVAILAIIALLIYLGWLWLELHRFARQYVRRPEVDRNGDGKRIKERI